MAHLPIQTLNMIADTWKQLLKRILDENLFRGKLDLPVITACMYIACRQQNVPRIIQRDPGIDACVQE